MTNPFFSRTCRQMDFCILSVRGQKYLPCTLMAGTWSCTVPPCSLPFFCQVPFWFTACSGIVFRRITLGCSQVTSPSFLSRRCITSLFSPTVHYPENKTKPDKRQRLPRTRILHPVPLLSPENNVHVGHIQGLGCHFLLLCFAEKHQREPSPFSIIFFSGSSI